MMNEKDLEKLLDNPLSQDLKLDKQIKKSLNQKIYMRIVIVLLVLTLISVAGWHLTSYVLDAVSYDPRDENDFIIEDESEVKRVNFLDNEEVRGFAVLFETYFNMTFPGYAFGFDSYESLGFGKYEIHGTIHDLFEQMFIGGPYNFTIYIDQSKMTYKLEDEDIYLTTYIQEYSDESGKNLGLPASDLAYSSVEEHLAYYQDFVSEYPDSAVIDASVTFKKPYTSAKLVDLMKKYPYNHIVFAPIGMNVGNCYGAFAGMSLGGFWVTDIDEEKYPNFYADFAADKTGKMMEEQYLSQLKLLLDHPEFVEIISKCFRNGGTLEELQERYDLVKNEGLNVIGLRVHMSKKDLLRLIESGEIVYLEINQDKLSRHSK